ncbi:hypothetical protein ITJ57_08345 [Plantibacter sp. VKM Ac-2880]|uniref:hypothetical protein n=1 Tax=Plantibacter sp. VKM Ac-2880 TaxID=2783827 RepID=UPI0018909E9B|nr:hypothetical protein [Plantibacter sp. VKM Ac-2880]MBF4568780.1 hypothetical protein [Plantibacter sp. VKM Ac-2880]
MSRTKRGAFRLKGGRRNIMRSDEPYLSFYCRGPQDAPHEKWRIGTVFASEHNGSVGWHESTSGYAEPSSDTLTKVYPPFTHWLDENEYIDRERHDPDVFEQPGFRVVWDLKCPKCRFARRIGNPAAHYGLIAELWGIGIREISLRAFTGRVEAPKTD